MRKGFRLLLVLLTFSLVQACSSGKVVKSYEGAELPQEQLGLLVASENISVLSINGKDVPTYMLNNIETTYGLKPGTNKVVFIYESIWAKAGAKSKGGSKTEKVTSKELVVDVVTKAGESYHFSFIKPSNVREAKEAIQDMQVTVYDSANIVAALSKVYEPEAELKALIASNDVKANELVAKEASLLVEKSGQTNVHGDDNYKKYQVSNTEALKAIWAKMTAKEKKAFLVWAFQE